MRATRLLTTVLIVHALCTISLVSVYAKTETKTLQNQQPGLSIQSAAARSRSQNTQSTQVHQRDSTLTRIEQQRERSSEDEIFLEKDNAPSKQCNPNCRWQCTDPECPAICQPVCNPPQCQIQCNEQACAECKVDCQSPQCTIRCPKHACGNQNCTKCQTVCAPAQCHTICTPPPPKCAPVCAPTICQLNCTKPSDCPRPKCRLECEQVNCSIGQRKWDSSVQPNCCPCTKDALTVAMLAADEHFSKTNHNTDSTNEASLSPTSPSTDDIEFPSFLEVFHTLQHSKVEGQKEMCCPC